MAVQGVEVAVCGVFGRKIPVANRGVDPRQSPSDTRGINTSPTERLLNPSNSDVTQRSRVKFLPTHQNCYAVC